MTNEKLATTAFDAFMETDEGKAIARRFGGAMQFFPIFLAGYRAGRDEPRSAAGEPTGGREPARS